MYCSQCGKKVKENMLFCPFCGSAIEIPEQDDERKGPESIPAQKESTDHSAKKPESRFGDSDESSVEEKVEFIPLDLDSKLNFQQPQDEPKAGSAARKASDARSSRIQEEPVRLRGRGPDLSVAGAHGAPDIPSRSAADTHVPQLQFDPDNMFLDEEDEDEFDDYEEDDLDYEFEEPEHGSFFMRHIRGFVTLLLFGVVVLVIFGWAVSLPGQQSLARAGLAWDPSVYAEVAFEAYQNGGYAQAGKFYEKAFEHADGNYDYANSAGVSYYMANDRLNAENMARIAIGINPSRPEAYELLLRLYPDTGNRPMEVSGLIESGYRLTGYEALNVQ